MAENDESRSRDDLTEEASPQRLEDFRRRGIVAQSKEITGLAALLAAMVVIFVMAPASAERIGDFMREVFRVDLVLGAKSADVLQMALIKALKLMIFIALPVCLAGFIVSAVSSFAQIGSIFSMEPMTPDLAKIDPLKGLQKQFSMKHLTEGLRLIFKIAVVSFVAYKILQPEIMTAGKHLLFETDHLPGAIQVLSKSIFFWLFGVLAVFAGIDFWIQRREYDTNLRMTKQEAKQEHKEREGDPQIKARIRAVQREVARRRMMKAVKTADVIVTNPTHYAVAILYEKDKGAAPKIVAKGADFLAQRIRQIAIEAGVPIVENPPLARTLYKSVKVGRLVPRALYQAVAEVLAYVYRLKNRGF